MAAYLNLFTPQTWRTSLERGSAISGFTWRQRKQCDLVQVGDLLLCYLTKLSRYVGIYKVASTVYEDEAPYYRADDPYIMRFNVEPLVALPPELGIPIHDPILWDKLEWTRNPKWGVYYQQSLRSIPLSDADIIVAALLKQKEDRRDFPLSEKDLRALSQTMTVNTAAGAVTVEIPDHDDDDAANADMSDRQSDAALTESLQVQARIAQLGATLGFKVWLPFSDRTRLGDKLGVHKDSLLRELPLNLNDAALTTIKNIDVLWVEGSAIIRAFEVEHTTAVYSGLLRMSDLLALVPNMQVPLHIVAPAVRRSKVFDEIRRPTFALMKPPLSKRCTYLSYDAIYELANQENLKYMSHEIVDKYADMPEDYA